MERDDFEILRDLPGKRISTEVRFRRQRETSPLVRAEGLRIENAAGVNVVLDISWNPVRGSRSFNVSVAGVGPICRLDADGPPHHPAGGTHKHSLQQARCPSRNLPDGVVDRPDLAGLGLRELFDAFCRMAKIEFAGTFVPPDFGVDRADD
jgi:hypothetical protein